MKKLVIANWGCGGQGKSSSLKYVFARLSKYPHRILINNGDVKAIVEIKEVKVGIESQGDPDSRMFTSLDDFVKEGCDIIVCACRCWGSTTNKVDSLKQLGYEIIWTQNDRTDNPSLHAHLNELYAEWVEQIITNHIAGIL